MRMTTLWILLMALALPLGCSRSQETADQAASKAGEVAAGAQEAASKAATTAKETASGAATTAKEKASEAAAAAGTAADELIGDPVAKCNELAAQGAWSEALDVCTKAHQAEPDNMAIEHALQQAKAAAGQ